MKIVVHCINTLLLILGLCLHISTYFYLDINKLSLFTKIYVLTIILLLFTCVIYLLVTVKPYKQKFNLLEAINELSFGLKSTLFIITLVTIIIFSYNSSLLSGGGTEIIDGKYVLSDNLRIIREISSNEYSLYQYVELRMNTIMFTFFNFVESIGFYYSLKARKLS